MIQRKGGCGCIRWGGKGWTNILVGMKGHVEALSWRSSKNIDLIASRGVSTVHLYGIPPTQEEVGDSLPSASSIILGSVSVSPEADGPMPPMPGLRGSAAFIGHSLEHPPEVYYTGVNGKQPERLTNSNPWLTDMKFAKQEVIKYKAKDGLELEGILIHPLNEEPGKRYPLILNVHGGPEAHYSNGWIINHNALGQVAAARGMAVFYPNYRGSTGYGVEFSKMGQAAAGGKEFDDLVDGVDHLIKMGLVDEKKVGITGGSYGGYATAWGSTYYSHRFAAGVMFVGISDWISCSGTTDIAQEMYLVHHRKWLWDDWEYFAKASPLKHLDKAKTPLLIMHGKADPRVNPGQSLEMYRHLKVRNQAPVRLVLYPGEGHGNRRTASKLDYNLRLLQWMEHYLKGPGGAMPAMDLQDMARRRRRRFVGRDELGRSSADDVDDRAVAGPRLPVLHRLVTRPTIFMTNTARARGTYPEGVHQQSPGSRATRAHPGYAFEQCLVL